MTIDPQRIESLGPAETLIQTLLAHAGHLYHGRPGIVTPSASNPAGATWEASSYKVEGDVKVAYFDRKVGSKNTKVRAGILGDDGRVREAGRVVGEYRQPGFFLEAVAWTYRQIASIYQMDNEFVARWASYAFGQEHRDLKAVLCAFLLVQSRRGDPILDGDAVAFYDEDYRDVGEAMCLIRRTDGKDFNPQLLLRVGDILRLPIVAAINRELGFTSSAKNPTMGRWDKVVTKYLAHREVNVWMLEGMVRAGMRTTVIALAQRVHYKPLTARFYQILRWRQVQARDGRRQIAIGAEVSAAESWDGLSEAQVCERIVETRPAYKRIVGLLPSSVGVTRAVMAAAVQAGSLSNQDLIILTPTLEELGLTTVEPVKSRWEAALRGAENQRAANIAANVKTKAVREKLQGAADAAMQKAVQDVVRGLRIYVFVDTSGSMERAIEEAKTYVAQLLGGFPLDKVHVATFNSVGREVTIQHASKAGVENAFRGIRAIGGTDYGSGVRALQAHKPAVDEDALFFFIGDEQHNGGTFEYAVTASGLNPVAFGLLKVGGSDRDRGVRDTAALLGIPCFNIDTGIFADVYAVPRTLRTLIAATPVGKPAPGRVVSKRVSLVETILNTDLLAKPQWAA